MTITVWTNEIKNLYVWSSAIKEAYVWDVKVRPSGWKPLNPKCWYKFDWDYTDATWTYWVASWTSTFQTLSSGVKVLQTNWSNMVSLPSGITANSISTYTVIFWMKPITTNPSYWYYAWCGHSNGSHISFYENTSWRDFVEWLNGSRDLTTSWVWAGWRLVCFRSNGSNCDLIVNWSNKTATTTAPSIFGYSSYNTFVLWARNMGESGTWQRTSVQMSNFVISTSYWDDATCLDMYNKTKADYWL